MKQFTIVLECVLDDGNPLFLIRDPRSGNVLKKAYSPDEVASFLGETISKVSSSNISENHG